MKPKLQIFLSYTREDRVRAEEIYRKLSEAGFKPWLDSKDILPGQQWESSIREAIRNSDLFLACLSSRSINKRGWFQREIRVALDIWKEMLPNDIYLIPVRLEDCGIPDSLSNFQASDLFEPEGWARLIKSIESRIDPDANGLESGALEFGSDSIVESSSGNQQTSSLLDRQSCLRAIDLVFIEEGESDCMLYWRTGNAFDFRRNQWEQMLLDAIPHNLLAYLFPKQVFLCLRGDNLIDGYDPKHIGDLLGIVREIGQGSSVYIVKDRNIGVSTFEHTSISLWIDEVLRGQAIDIIEIEMDRYSLEPLNLKQLKAASDLSKRRRRAISPIDPQKKWKCFIPEAEYFLHWFLEPFVVYPHLDVHDGGTIIVVKSYQETQRRFFDRILHSSLDRYMVIWLSYLPIDSELKKACDQRELKLIHCRGPFELHYLLLRLNPPYL